MPEFARRTRLPHPPKAVWEWYLRPGAFARLSPPWDPIEVVAWAPIERGARQELVVHKGRGWRWTAQITEVDPGRSFTDVQERGPFARWEHHHAFLPADHGTDLEDRIRWEPPLGALGQLVAGSMIERDLERTFAFRHARTGHDLARHARFAADGTRRVALSGASGLIGGDLAAFLGGGGHEVLRLVRRPVHNPREVQWRPEAERIDATRLEGVHAVVHLAGETTAQRWTDAAKQRIRDSRVRGTRLLSETLAGLDRRPDVLVCASAVGIYGDRGDEELDEQSAPGIGFLAQVCQEWEQATEAARRAGIRVVNLRLGVVLDPRGGALGKLLPLYRLGLGGRVGRGTQFWPWIALDDVVGLIEHAIFDESLSGRVNAVAPEHTTQAELSEVLGGVLHRPKLVRVPGPEVRLLFGEMGKEQLLFSRRVAPSRATAAGFPFLYPSLEPALRAMLGRLPEPTSPHSPEVER